MTLREEGTVHMLCWYILLLSYIQHISLVPTDGSVSQDGLAPTISSSSGETAAGGQRKRTASNMSSGECWIRKTIRNFKLTNIAGQVLRAVSSAFFVKRKFS